MSLSWQQPSTPVAHTAGKTYRHTHTQLQNIAGLTAQQLAERCKRPEIAALLADVAKNGYPEPAVAPTKVAFPLAVRQGHK